MIENDLQTKLEEGIVKKTEEELNKVENSSQWREKFRLYAKDINEKFNEYQKRGENIRLLMEELYKDGKLTDEVQIYSSIDKVQRSTSETMLYNLRFRGQSICDIEVYDNYKIKAHITADDIACMKKSFFKDDPNKDSIFSILGIDAGNCYDVDGEEIERLINILKDKEPQSPEHQLESLMLRELYKKKSENKNEGLHWIQPVTLGECFFQLRTPLAASHHKAEYAKNGKGGGIDILARVSKRNGFGWRLAVIELKDQNVGSEPVDKVMMQVLTYATFVAHLLADENCGKDWYNIFRGKYKLKKDEDVPNEMEILAVAMMPKYKGTSKRMINKIEEIKTIKRIEKYVGKKKITLIPCTCYVDNNTDLTKILDVEGSLPADYKKPSKK